MNTLPTLLGRLMILAVCFALSGFGGSARAGILFSDGDFEAQLADQAVGAPWGPVGDGHIVILDAQSPYGNVYSYNGKGARIYASGGNPYLVRSFPENEIPASSTETLYFNVDFRNNSAESGDYSIVLTSGANGGLRSVALYITGNTIYADSATGVQPVMALEQGVWYNLQLTLDLATKTYAGVVSTFAGSTIISSRPFVRSDQPINCVYTDGGTSFAGGASPEHDMDNWALSNTLLPPLTGGAFVKSTAPHGTAVSMDTPVTIELEDSGTEVNPASIQLFLNGQIMAPVIDKPAESAVTTVSYAPEGGWRPSAYAVKLIFSDTATPPASQTNEYAFTVPGPSVTSVSPVGPGNKPDATITIELTDINTQVADESVQLFLNGQAVTPVVTRAPGSDVATVSYAPPAALAPNSTQVVRIIFGDSSTPPVLATNEFSFQVADPLMASSVVNIDFKGLRNVPGPDVLGPTYEGVSPAGGGRVFNSIIAESSLPGGGDDDNLTLNVMDLVDSFGDLTAVGFNVSPMGGDVGWAPTTNPRSEAALFGDYIFNNSAGNTAGESPFEISGLGNVPFVDLYFYRTGGGVTIPGAGTTTFPGQGIFTPANTFYFRRVPVTGGMVSGTFGSGTAVICGLSIVSPLPRPFIKSVAPTGAGIKPDASITVELEDYVTEVAAGSIQLLVNGTAVTPSISKPEGTSVTTVTYAPPSNFGQGSTNIVTIMFGDTSSPSIVQSNEFTFVVLSEASAAVTINIDFNGARNNPGPRGPGPTYVGQGASGGGNFWNGLLADSRLPDMGDDDNLTVGGENLLNSLGSETLTSFTIATVGGDDGGAPAGTDPASAAALLGDYVFVGSAGQVSGMADFTIGGLETAPYVDLFFYFGANGDYTIPGASPSPFSAKGIFTPANTICFKKVPVTDGMVSGVLGIGRVSVLYGLTIQKPLPKPVVNSFTPNVAPGAKLRTNEVGTIQIVLRDYISQVVASSIQLSLNGRAVSPQINQEMGEGLTTVSYDPFGALLPDATNTVRVVFSDNSNPPVVQTQEFSFWVMSEETAARIINIDFNGNRNIPGPNSEPLTYVGQGAAAGGTVFNGLAADSRLEDGSDNDNLTVSGTELVSSIGTATPVSFTVSPVGGDSSAGRSGGNTDDPANPAALMSDYIFNNSSGNQAGQSPFTIDGLGSASTVDLYFYKSLGSVFIPGKQPSAFAATGIFTPANTVYFAGVPVTEGQVTGSIGGGVTVIGGMTIVLPPPSLGSLSITRAGNNVIVSWSGAGTLQSADELTGEWQDVSGAANPLTLVSPQGHKFYRLRP